MRRLAPLVLLLALVPACGTQVSTATRERLAEAQLSGGAAVTGAAPGTPDGAVDGSSGTPVAVGGTSGAAVPGSTTTGGTAVGTTGGTTGSVIGGSAGGSAPSDPMPPGGNGGSTDVGVTATQILLGQVSDLSGPQPGLFQSTVAGTNAYIAYVNSTGGLFGRQLKISVADSQTSCEGNRTGHQGLVSKAFAFAGSFSLFDSCGASVLKANPGVPDAHLAVTPEANALANNFSVVPIGNTVNNGPYKWAADKFGKPVVENAAFMYVNLPAVTNVARLQKKSAESVGWKFRYERAVAATETDFTADIIQMRQRGIKMFYALFNADQMANFKPQADQQQFKPVVMDSLMYDQSFFKKLGGSAAAEGIYGAAGSALFFTPADAKVIPGVALFQKWYGKVSGGVAADTFAAGGWAETALLVQAMRAAGPKLTRAAVLAELKKIKSFDADGMYAPANPAEKKAGNCYVIWRITKGDYIRTDTPAADFRCDGRPA